MLLFRFTSSDSVLTVFATSSDPSFSSPLATAGIKLRSLCFIRKWFIGFVVLAQNANIEWHKLHSALFFSFFWKYFQAWLILFLQDIFKTFPSLETTRRMLLCNKYPGCIECRKFCIKICFLCSWKFSISELKYTQFNEKYLMAMRDELISRLMQPLAAGEQ